MEYLVKKNIVTIKNSEEKLLCFEFLLNDTIRIYTKKNKTDLIELNLFKTRKKFEIKEDNGNIVINYLNYTFKINDKLGFDLYINSKFITAYSFNVYFDDYEKKNYFNTTLNINNKTDYIFGLGDKMSYLDKKGYFYASYNTDDPSHQDELFPSLYKSLNYLLLNISDNFLGLYFPSTYRYTYDLGKTNLDEVKINNFNAHQDFFLFLGKSIKDITKHYSFLVGHPYMVRMKMLGNSQSRWSYENEKMVMDVYDNYKKYDLPLDYIHLDIHYMDGYRDFTIDESRFPNMKELTSKLKEGKVEIVAINDAAIKKDTNFEIYNYLEEHKLFAKLDKKTYINAVWPGDSAFPNYNDPKCQEYFKNIGKDFLIDTGISGLWCDMNEPASFNGPLPLNVDHTCKNRKLLHEEEHNVYGEHMVKSFVNTFKELNLRPYIFTRAGMATTSKYAFCWNGDNFSLWHHLRYSLTQNLSLSLSNFMFNGVDIGGFGGDGSKELLIRWIEANAFMPFIRNHSSLNTKSQEPYAFDDETIAIYKKYLDIRYKFIPYLYNLVYLMNKEGSPIIKPLFYNYENDKTCYTINDEYMVGDDLLVAPILNKDERNRIIYLPKGEWINYFTKDKIKGNKFIILNENLSETGYFIRNNTIIPEFENLKYIEKEEIDTLVLNVYGDHGETFIYEDDGKTLNYEKGEFNIYKASIKNGQLTFTYKKKGYNTPFKFLKVIYLGHEYKLEFNEYKDFTL